MQHNAYQACLQSAVAEINRRVDSFMRETTTTLTELRISLQYTLTQVEELKVNQSKENIDDLSKKMLDFEDMIQKMERSIDYQENQSRRCILRFDGVSEVDVGADGEERTQGNDNSLRTSRSTSARHQHRARSPNWRHGDESQDSRRQVQIIQGP